MSFAFCDAPLSGSRRPARMFEGGEQGGAQYMDGPERFSVRSRTP